MKEEVGNDDFMASPRRLPTQQEGLPLTNRPADLIRKLTSFTSNISRGRKRRRGREVDDALIDACNSLVHFLRDESHQLSQTVVPQYDDDGQESSFPLVNDVLETALIAAIRAASEVGDFVLLQKLVVAAVDYVSAIDGQSYSQPLRYDNDEEIAPSESPMTQIRLSPRIFGEALRGMSITKVSTSKLKSLWSYFAMDVAMRPKGQKVLSTPPSSYELNAMLTSLGNRGKVSAALRVYRNVTVHDAYGWTGEGGRVVRGDAYTASALFGMLAESISSSSSSLLSPSSSLSYSNSKRGNSSADVADVGALSYQMSPCWQWNEAMALLDTFSPSQLNNHAYAALLKVNERAVEKYSNAQDTITMMTTMTRRHNGVRCAMMVLERMRTDKISPDVVTCSVLMNTFEKGRNWKAAVTLLSAMRQPSRAIRDDDMDSDKKWSLPYPNTYTYSMAISICARCNQGKLALSLLNEMEESASSSMNDHMVDCAIIAPNTWVYNAAIVACLQGSSVDGEDGTYPTRNSNSKGGTHLVTAFDILEKMERSEGRDCGNSKMKNEVAQVEYDADCRPDVVTYNTLLSILDETALLALKEEFSSRSDIEKVKGGATDHSIHRLLKHDRITDVVNDILDTMETRKIERDIITYYNAIMACRESHRSASADAVMILRRSFSDRTFMLQYDSNHKTLESKTRQLKGRAASGVIFLANTALSIASKLGDVRAVSEVLSLLPGANIKLNTMSIVYIIHLFGRVNDCEAILALLICLRGQSFANDILKVRYSIDILSNMSDKAIPMVEEEIYSAAITSCLKHDSLGAADQILSSMKKNGLTLKQRSLKDVISEYCRMAMISSKEEFKVARQAKRQGIDDSRYGIVEPIYITSLARAKAALTMLKAVESPPPSLFSSVAKACCAAGLWQDARSLLRRMHRTAIRELRLVPCGDSNDSSFSSVSHVQGGAFLDELPRLHRSLLKFCAKGGNITPALNFADDIQFLASQMRRHGKAVRSGMVTTNEDEQRPKWSTVSSRLLMDAPTPNDIPETDFSDTGALSSILERPIGLTGQDWKLILIAASRGGHWKVCVGTLPFIRPYVKETHPMYARESLAISSHGENSRPTLDRLNRKHDRIARALTAAVLCFEARSQYAWALRAIDDWIEWSGRRPRKEAIASACRILAMRHRGQEVLTLVAKIMGIPHLDCSANIDVDDELDDVSEYTYEKAIYTESINALHKNGLYIEADQLYAEGVASGHLPWAVINGVDHKQLKLDLHGMSAAVAHAAVRVSLQNETMASNGGKARSTRDVLIITGRGRSSGERFRPVLRPEVQRMLTEEFYPPLGTSSIPGNMGALLVPSKDIKGWLDHQRKQKGERLLIVADVLRDISSGNRLERALLRNFKSLDVGSVEHEDT